MSGLKRGPVSSKKSASPVAGAGADDQENSRREPFFVSLAEDARWIRSLPLFLRDLNMVAEGVAARPVLVGTCGSITSPGYKERADERRREKRRAEPRMRARFGVGQFSVSSSFGQSYFGLSGSVALRECR